MPNRHARGFAAMDPAKHRRISALGGRSHGRSNGQASDRERARGNGRRTRTRAM